MKNKRITVVACFLFIAVAGMSAEDVVTDTLGTVKSVARDPSEILRGRMSGVRVSATDGSPSGQLNVNIRGLNTLRGDSQPLWIVDGAVIGSSLNYNLNSFYLSGGATINGDPLPDYSGRSYTSPKGNFSWLNPYDIESIEVLKDISATSRYGMQGANGVVIVRTRRPYSNENNIWANYDVGLVVPTQKGEAFGNGILSSYDLGMNGMLGTNSFYNISGWLRSDDRYISKTGSTLAGAAVNLETAANNYFHFGLNSFLSYGDMMSSSGTNFLTQPSVMLLSRYPDGFAADRLSDWISSFDDETLDFRSVNSVWLRINLLKTLKLTIAGGMDYQNQTRYIWHGTGTSFGKEFSGATGILNNSLLNYNASAELKYDRTFAVMHRLRASLLMDLTGYANRTNAMCGTDFDLPYLRGKGLSSSGSVHAISKFNRKYNRAGADATLAYDFGTLAGIRGSVRYEYSPSYDRAPLFLPSAEAYFNIKGLIPENPVLSTLRLTAGFGKAGRETVLPYEYLDPLISAVPSVQRGAEPYFDGLLQLASGEWNIGLESGVLNDRILFKLKYYDKTTEDIFRLYNNGKILSDLWVRTRNWTVEEERRSVIGNKGVEVDFAFTLADSGRLKWTLDVNAAFNDNRIESADPLDGTEGGILDGICHSAVQNGKPVGLFLGENTLPKCHGGISTVLSFYGFTFDARICGAAGFSIVNAGKMIENGSASVTEDMMEAGDYLRLQDIGLSYRIPLKVKWIKAVNVNFSAHNLLALTDYSGWNPDVNSFGVNVRSHGFDYGSYPLLRSFLLGISLKF